MVAFAYAAAGKRSLSIRSMFCSGVTRIGSRVGLVVLPSQACESKRSGASRVLTQKPVRMVVDPWSVSPETVDIVAAQLFAVSLAPYLAFLYYLERPQNSTPKLASFGFRFLLVFVLATIPAGIYAKVHYNDILANVDWLHGSAESLLTLTNLFITIGMRNAMLPSTGVGNEKKRDGIVMKSAVAAGAVALCAAGSVALPVAVHLEPANALSLPTWVIHVSSLIEWLVAMNLVWRFAEKSGNPRWKGLTWGMLPLHTSGLCACTYHLFYNAPSLNLLVAFQAGLTCFGNATMALAAYRVASFPAEDLPEGTSDQTKATSPAESDATFVFQLFLLSAVASGVVKWGSLFLDPVFDASSNLAVALIVVPTLLNVLKWTVRSNAPDSRVGRML